MSVDQQVEHAEVWWRAVEAAVDYLANDYDIEPDDLLQQEAFVSRLDGTVGLNPDTDAERFAELVEAAVAEHTAESFQPEHAEAGSPTGGQFTGGGSGGGSKPPPRRRRGGKPAPKKPSGPMGFDGKTGTGYDTPGGDPGVKEVQGLLNKLGFTDAQGKPLAVDGKFGPRTTAAVRAMQQKYGLPADGKVTPELLARLKAPAAAKPAAKHAKAAHAKESDARLVGEDGPELAFLHEGDYVADSRVTEAEDHIEGQVTEALGTDADGCREFRVRIIATGTSKNKKRYTESVLRSAAPLYEGAKAFDHHRTPAEMQTSTVAGLVGWYRKVAYDGDGLYGNLRLLPGATHTAEALDASIAAQAAGLQPIVGISHDVLASFRPDPMGRHVQEAVAITRVHSADVVADPSAGGQATRVLAGGIEDTEEEAAVPITAADIDAIAAAVLERVQPQPVTESTTEPERVTESGEPKTSFMASLMIGTKLAAAGLPEAVKESFTAALPERITEADVDTQIGAYKGMLAGLERAGLAPTVTAVVTQESHEKKIAALDAFFAQDWAHGFRSFREAFIEITGKNPLRIDEDFNKVMMRESVVAYDSDGRIRGGERTTESLSATSWNLVLGDSITRRLVAEYEQPSLQSYKAIVSSTVPVNDFRTQRVDRIGGYGVLPAVNQGAPYQPLTSPTNEEVTYALTKRGGTEDITLEMIANDDVRSISRIPKKLGLAAAQTLFRFVWDFLDTNPAIYDAVTLFNASHGTNTATNALSQTNLSAGRLAMRSQTAYGDTTNNLSFIPKTLIAVNDIEEIAFQLSTSAVAIPATPAGPSDTPNLHKGLDLIIPDYWTSTTKWILVADPQMVPTFELGFYQGRDTPELFTQSDPTVGSMFNADTLTMKIRHIYSGAVLDWRGFYRGNT